MGDDRDFNKGSDERVNRILARSRREAGVRDLVTFGAGRAWLAVVSVGAAILSLLLRPKQTRAERAGSSQPEEEET